MRTALRPPLRPHGTPTANGPLGHKDVATTLRIYAHVLPGMQREAAEAMDSVLF